MWAIADYQTIHGNPVAENKILSHKIYQQIQQYIAGCKAIQCTQVTLQVLVDQHFGSHSDPNHAQHNTHVIPILPRATYGNTHR